MIDILVGLAILLLIAALVAVVRKPPHTVDIHRPPEDPTIPTTERTEP